MAAPPSVVVGGKNKGKDERSDQNLGNDTILEMISLPSLMILGE